MHRLLVVVLLAAACGEEDQGPPPKTAQAGAPGGQGGAPAATNKNKLEPRKHVEENVACPVLDKPTGPSCKPDAPICEPGKYCLQVNNTWSCEPCPERDSIRHEFKDRDFVPDQVRDPFQSFIIVQKGLEPNTKKGPETGPCNRPEQFVASNYSYLDLKLVGIISLGTQRKALMVASNYGHIVRRGDCVGKEKALVKEIGTGFVTFVVRPDSDERNPNLAPAERSIVLHPKGLQVAPQPQFEAPPGSTAPVVTPGSNMPPPPATTGPAPVAPTR